MFARVAAAAPSNNECSLPVDLKPVIARNYPNAKPISLSDLQEDDLKFFQSDHPNACPGIVKVDFYGDGKPAIALALVIKSGVKEHTDLIVAHYVGGQWRTTRLETDSGDTPVVWSQPPGEYVDVYGNKKIRAKRSVIVFCKYESWAILYA
jgi:hypothetical protein